jgi:pyrroloquinoline quinone biosynthesis protein B
MLVLLCACAGDPISGEPPRPPAVVHPPAPRLVALGTAQDGGFPHAACGCTRCAAARLDPAQARAVASLGLILPGGQRYLLDATPDIRPQIHALAVAAGQTPDGGVDRQPLAGIFLTHAHMGHYTGLAFLGFEAIHTQGVPVHCTPRMAGFLRGNGPWSQLVELGNIEIRELPPGVAVDLGAGVSVRALQVPHRDEYSDTVGFIVAGPAQRVLYVPDTDAWQAWDPALPAVLAQEQITIAILDATFFAAGELPGRDPASIGHPLVGASMDLLQAQVDAGLQVLFTHLNHSNPMLAHQSAARREVERRGFGVLADGQEIPL